VAREFEIEVKAVTKRVSHQWLEQRNGLTPAWSGSTAVSGSIEEFTAHRGFFSHSDVEDTPAAPWRSFATNATGPSGIGDETRPTAPLSFYTTGKVWLRGKGSSRLRAADDIYVPKWWGPKVSGFVELASWAGKIAVVGVHAEKRESFDQRSQTQRRKRGVHSRSILDHREVPEPSGVQFQRPPRDPRVEFPWRRSSASSVLVRECGWRRWHAGPTCKWQRVEWTETAGAVNGPQGRMGKWADRGGFGPTCRFSIFFYISPFLFIFLSSWFHNLNSKICYEFFSHLF
jgi:hypothetical protein